MKAMGYARSVVTSIYLAEGTSSLYYTLTSGHKATAEHVDLSSLSVANAQNARYADNAGYATSATNDGSSNNIESTYAKKSDLNNYAKTSQLPRKSTLAGVGLSIYTALNSSESLQDMALKIPIYVFLAYTSEPHMVPCFAKISSSRTTVYLYAVDLQNPSSSSSEKGAIFMTIDKSTTAYIYGQGCNGNTTCILL